MWKNRLIAFFGIIASAILIGVRGGAAAYLLFYTAAGIPVLSLLYAGYVYQRFCIYQKLEQKTVVKGERVPYTFRLANEDRIPYFSVSVEFFADFSSVEHVDAKKSYFLKPGEGLTNATVLTCGRRGEYPVGISHARVRDYFSLFSITYPVETRIEMTVYPRIVKLTSFAYTPEHTEEKDRRAGISARQEVPDSELRRYVDGDSMRMIHWKASAAGGQLMSRKYVEESKHMICVMPDFSSMEKASLGREEEVVLEDKLLEAVLAVTDYLRNGRTGVRLLFGTEDSGTEGLRAFDVFTEADMKEWYRICCEVRFRALLKPEELLYPAAAYIPASSHMMLFTSELSKELYGQLKLLKRNGTESTIFYISREHGGEEGLMELFKEDFCLCVIPYDREPVPILEGREQLEADS